MMEQEKENTKINSLRVSPDSRVCDNEAEIKKARKDKRAIKHSE